MPIYLCLSPAAKKQVDPVHVARSSILGQEIRPTSCNRASKVFSAVVRRKKTPSETTASDEATIEHLEGRGNHSAEWPG